MAERKRDDCLVIGAASTRGCPNGGTIITESGCRPSNNTIALCYEVLLQQVVIMTYYNLCNHFFHIIVLWSAATVPAHRATFLSSLVKSPRRLFEASTPLTHHIMHLTLTSSWYF
jgi:hypothetical protein